MPAAFHPEFRRVARKLLDEGLTCEMVGPLLGITGRSVRGWFPSVDGSSSKIGLRTAKAREAVEPAPEIPRGSARHPATTPHGQVKGLEADGKVFLITAAQNATPVHKPFLRSLERYAKRIGARLIVVPYRYQNPSSLFTDGLKDQEWWAADIAKYLSAERLKLNKNLILCADLKIVATAVQPLSGLHAETGQQSAIFGHPRRALRTVATPQNAYPKQLFTTAACTVANYTDSKLGKRGHAGHTLGAVIVEIDGDIFHHRQITASDDGSFYDLAWHCTEGGVTRADRVSGVVMGDIHVDVVDPTVVAATFGARGICNTLQPRELVWHDVIDSHSISHHNERDPVLKIAKHFDGSNDIEKEIHRALAFVDTHSPSFCVNIIPASNHNEHVSRWVRDNAKNPARDPQNVQFWSMLFVKAIEYQRRGEHFDPLAWMATQYLACANRTRFLARDEHHAIEKFAVDAHGDLGVNGSRGSLIGLSRMAVDQVIAHGHGPGIEGKCVQVGTSTLLRLSYNRGPSNWLHTHFVIYPDGNGTLVNVVKGKWRLEHQA